MSLPGNVLGPEDVTIAAPSNTIVHRHIGTWLIPLDPHGELEDANWIGYLLIVAPGAKQNVVERTINRTRMVEDAQQNLDVPGTIAALTSALTRAGVQVQQIIYVEGLTWMKEPS